MIVNSKPSTRSGHILYPGERLREVATRLKEQAHVFVCGLPGTGKSTFVRQLADLETRERLGLDRTYLMALLDGHEFAHSSLEYVWGAVLTAFSRARVSLSEVCKREDAPRVEYKDLKDAMRSFRHSRLVLVLDNCSGLHAGPGWTVCHDLLHLDIKHSPTLIVVPNLPCDQKIRDEFVTMDITLSPEQALRFLDQALPQLGIDSVVRNRLSREIVDWVGGNLSLLDSVCYWTTEVSANFPNRYAYPGLSRAVYENCLKDAEPFFAGWWQTLNEREQMIVLAMDELQRLTAGWQNVMGELVGKGLVQEQGDRYLVSPRMFGDFVSKQPTTRDAGPFRLDLKKIQTVYVNGKPCSLSRGQACAFFRLFVHRNQIVPYTHLFADLYTPHVSITGDKVHEMDTSSTMLSVDRGLDELCKALTVGGLIERVPPDAGTPLRGYCLAVSSPGQAG